jgi:hypothetical protein
VPKKRKPKPREYPVTYIASVDRYAADYSFSVGSGHDYDLHPYSEHFSIQIDGVVKITTSAKVKLGTPVKIHIMGSVRDVDEKFKPLGVGFMDSMKGYLNAIISLPPQSVHYLLTLLETGKIEVVDLFGSEMKHRHSTIRSFRATTAFEWQDWKEDTPSKPENDSEK